jgi:hypothetical protein
VRHPTYKHLEARLRLGAFSLGQWAQIGAAGAAAAVFGVYLSPFPASVTVFVSIVAAGMPVALSYGAMGLEFSVGQFAWAAWRYWRVPRHYLPGPGEAATGYVVQAALADRDQGKPERHTSVGEGVPLWDV